MKKVCSLKKAIDKLVIVTHTHHPLTWGWQAAAAGGLGVWGQFVVIVTSTQPKPVSENQGTTIAKDGALAWYAQEPHSTSALPRKTTSHIRGALQVHAFFHMYMQVFLCSRNLKTHYLWKASIRISSFCYKEPYYVSSFVFFLRFILRLGIVAHTFNHSIQVAAAS